jgi:protein-L-isoaspartate(D-aspartate) O-methyltransferase
MQDAAARREQMVERQIAARGVRDPQVLRAMRKVPREQFVSSEHLALAYEDSPLPIDEGQTISQPYIVALMAEALELGPADRVLEIGTGSGYAAAVLAEIAREVHTIERHTELAHQAVERLARLGYQNVWVRRGDGTLGWAESAPFDGIAVTAGGREVPKTLLAQLAIGGRLVIPIGPTANQQTLVRITRRTDTEYAREELGKVQFVPLIADDGELEH